MSNIQKKSLGTCSESMFLWLNFAKMAEIMLPYNEKLFLPKIYVWYVWIANLMLITYNRNIVWKSKVRELRV